LAVVGTASQVFKVEYREKPDKNHNPVFGWMTNCLIFVRF
jgi:hypothetical protein